MKRIILNIGLILFTLTVMSQNIGIISGRVIDYVTGSSISDVEILIKETGQGTIVNKNGQFIIENIKSGTYTLQSHLMGFESKILKNINVKSGQTTNVLFKIKIEDIGLNEVTISATKIQKRIDKIGSPVYVINSREIERTEGRNIDEALVRVPGVFTEDRHHDESNVVSFRGVGLHTHVTRGILVLVDGVSLTEAMGRTDFEGIDMENAERVEVLKGPVSALYGSNGITGVINIIEKSPMDGLNGQFKASVGNYNTTNISANVNGGKNGFKYLIKGKYYNSDGYQDRSGYFSARAGVKISKQFKRIGNIKFSADYISTKSDSPGTLDSAMFYERSREATNLFSGYDKDFYRINLGYSKTWNENSDMIVNLYYRNRDGDGFYEDPSYSIETINSMGGEIRNKMVHTIFGNKNTLVVGMSLEQEIGEDQVFSRNTTTGEIENLEDKGKSIYDIMGIYLEDEYLIFEKLAFTVGLRFDLINYDWNDQFEVGDENTSSTTNINALSPKFGFAYNPNKNITVFGNIARGFNPPQISQLFIGSTYAGLPNPDLKPEYLTNYEIGIRGNLKQKFIYQISFFRMDFKDQISSEINPEVSTETPQYQNIGYTRHQGIETSFEYRFNNNFNIYTNYSYLDARFVDNPDYGNNKLRKTPSNLVNAGIRYQFKFGLSAAIDYKFMDKYFMDNDEKNLYEGYSIVNLKLRYEYKELMASFSVNNLFDANYATWAYASESYNYMTHQTSWDKKYIPGWPVNFNFTLAYKISFNK